MIRQATIDESGRYRYRLYRSWGPARTAVFIMLNPSTADAVKDDPTIRKCISFAHRWGYGALEIVNLFAYRATSPSKLLSVGCNPVGEENNTYILGAVRDAGLVVCAWGGWRSADSRVLEVHDLLANEGMELVRCLGTTKNGAPRHPLYLSLETKLQSYRPTGRNCEGI